MHKEIWIACDHGGYELKLKLMEHLQEKSVACKDIGTHSADIVRYPYYAAQVAWAVSTGQTDCGILICSTGIGMSIAANRYQGVRASLCHDVSEAQLTRAHNNSNILCLGGKIIGEFEAKDILDAWMHTEYTGGRHDISLGLITELEGIVSTGKEWVPQNNNL